MAASKIYYYAWKSGPPLVGEPGSPEFTASYNEAVARKVDGAKGHVAKPPATTTKQSSDFTRSARARTKTDYQLKDQRISKSRLREISRSPLLQ